jgi:endonuclease/exonuclease/phosphatase family metal-dependent hydrolase
MLKKTGIPALLLRLARLHLGKTVLAGLGLLLACAGLLRGGCAPEPLRLATFNIRNYPESPQQEQGAFRLIRELGVQALGVQEITDPVAFAVAARRHLGSSWRFAYPAAGPQQRVGVLYDEAALALRGTRTHQQTVVYPGAKPTFEVQLQPRRGALLRLLVVHLKAGGKPEDIELRARQMAGLAGLLGASRAQDERLVLLGDFNTTSALDLRRLGEVATATGLTWASRALSCTSYWEREQGCQGTALDHILTLPAPGHIQARGPCETEGCEQRAACPVFHRQVSDHCPVAFSM